MAKEVLYFSKKNLQTRDALINEAMLWGNTFFSTALVKRGKFIFWDEHRDRLKKCFDYCWPEEDSEKYLNEVQHAAANIIEEYEEIEHAYFRITFFRELSGEINFWLWALEKEQQFSALSLRAKCYDPNRNFPTYFKRSDYQYQFKLRREAIAQGASDALLLDLNSYLLELPTANLILKKADEYYSPRIEKGILEGITLKKIEAMLANHGRRIRYEKIHASELREFDHCFSTSSFNGIRPICSIDEISYNEDKEIKKLMLDYYGEIW